jgi:hypothetical protein
LQEISKIGNEYLLKLYDVKYIFFIIYIY